MASSSPVLSSFTRPGNSRFLADFTLPRRVITCSRALSIWRERIPCFLMSHRCCCDRRLSQMTAVNGFRILILFSGRPGHDGMFYGMFFQFLLNVEMICIVIIFIKIAGISIRGKPGTCQSQVSIHGWPRWQRLGVLKVRQTKSPKLKSDGSDR